MTQATIGRGRLSLLGGLFLLSGATALVYQVVWVRVLSLTIGSTVAAISLVIAAFMAGLAIGSAWIGRRIDSGGHPLRVYGWLELGIGVAGVLVPIATGALGRISATGDGFVGSTAFPMVAAFLMLLVPTTMMGGTLPVLARYVVGLSNRRGGAIGWLYAINTLGAIVGSLATGFLFIRLFGIWQTSLLAAVTNGLIFLVAYLLSRDAIPAGSGAAAEKSPAKETKALSSRVGYGLITAVYAVNGLVGLGLEVLWTRAIVLFTINTIYAFTVILTTFLFGLALGSTLMATRVERVARPAVTLGWFQVGIGLLAAITPLGIRFLGLPTGLEQNLTPLQQIRDGYIVSLVFILPATLLMGASFPLVARLLATEVGTIGRRIGNAYALNTLGAVFGSFLATFVLLPAMGIQRSILVLAIASALAGLFLLMRLREGRAWPVAAVVPAGATLILFLAPNQFRAALEEAIQPLSFYREGVETTVGAYESELARRPVLLINNVALEDRGAVHKLLAHLPALFHPDPERALVLGFGVGISNQSFSTYDLPVNDCVEISPAVMEAAPQFASLNGNIADRGDPNFRAIIEDGRRFLLSSGDPYDIIVLDANSGNLRNAGVGKLYTEDFFRLCRDRLADDGMVTLYASPNGNLREFRMIIRTFLEVFPESSLWIDRVYGQTCVLIGGREKLEVDVDRYSSRLADPEVQADLAVFDLDQPGMLLSCFVMGSAMLDLFTRGAEINTDDRPIMEFFPIRMHPFDFDDRPFADNGFQLYRESVRPYTKGLERHPEIAEFVAKSEQVFPTLFDSWLHRWNGNAQHAAASLRMAVTVHEEAEYLRGLLGYGRAAREAARARAVDEGDAAAWDGYAATLLSRHEYESAFTAAERAVEVATESGESSRLAGLYLALARSARELGRLGLASDFIDKARAAGGGVDFDEAELRLALARVSGDDLVAPLRGVVATAVAPQRLDLTRAYEAISELEALGVSDVSLVTIAARYLEVMGDMPGAYARYRDILRTSPQDGAAVAGVNRAAIEIGLRRDVFQRAYAEGPRLVEPLTSVFTDERAPTNITRRNASEAAPWLELAGHYLRSGRPVLAYRRARAARTMEPDAISPYVAIGTAAEAVQNYEIARLAYERALDLGAERSQLGGGAERLGIEAS